APKRHANTSAPMIVEFIAVRLLMNLSYGLSHSKEFAPDKIIWIQSTTKRDRSSQRSLLSKTGHTIAFRAINLAASPFTFVAISGLVSQLSLTSVCSSLPGSRCQLFLVEKQWQARAVSCSMG